MRVTVSDHRGVLFEGNVAYALIPAQGVMLSVGEYHQPMICRMVKGTMTLFFSGKDSGKRAFSLAGGVSYINGNELQVFAGAV